MNSKLFDRLVLARARLEKLGLGYVTVTLPLDTVLSVNWSVQEYIADTMERQAASYEAMDDTGTPLTTDTKRMLDKNIVSSILQQKGKAE